MPKQVPSHELTVVIRAVARLPKGGSIEEIKGVLDIKMPHRTLQRRLALLAEQKRLSVEGRGRASRYRLPLITGGAPLVDGGKKAAPREDDIPLSPESDALKQAVREPIQKRKPVGYNRAFLDAYRPNETFYLSAEIRQRLAELGRPPEGGLPAGTYARQVLNRLLIDLSWNSSRLEGNTYSLLETKRLLEFGEGAAGKDAREAQMILNHKAAIDLLVGQSAEVGFNRYTICSLHALLSDNLLADPRACGRLRSIGVGVGGAVFRPLEGPQLIEECFQQILDTATAIKDGFEQAFFVMVHLPYLQPFEDVNKRVSRLAANIPLIRLNVCPLSFVDVPQQLYVDGLLAVYELNRIELLRDVFVWAYERSCASYSAVRRSLGDPDPFRLRYRVLVAEVVGAVVRDGMDKKAAAVFVERRVAEAVPKEDQSRFTKVAETEIAGLHEGNIARYQLRPSQYQAWQKTWR